jgi:hypothetical protein
MEHEWVIDGSTKGYKKGYKKGHIWVTDGSPMGHGWNGSDKGQGWDTLGSQMGHGRVQTWVTVGSRVCSQYCSTLASDFCPAVRLEGRKSVGRRTDVKPDIGRKIRFYVANVGRLANVFLRCIT